jgi:hypothetical protein
LTTQRGPTAARGSASQLLLTGELAKANLAALLFEYLPPMMTPLSRPSSSHIATIASRPVSRRRPRGGLHVRNLAPSTMYLWHVHEGSCAATGAPVAGWTYRTQVGANGTLTSDASGNANTR